MVCSIVPFHIYGVTIPCHKNDRRLPLKYLTVLLLVDQESSKLTHTILDVIVPKPVLHLRSTAYKKVSVLTAFFLLTKVLSNQQNNLPTVTLLKKLYVNSCFHRNRLVRSSIIGPLWNIGSILVANPMFHSYLILCGYNTSPVKCVCYGLLVSTDHYHS